MEWLTYPVEHDSFEDIRYCIEEIHPGWFGLVLDDGEDRGGERWRSYNEALLKCGPALEFLVKYWSDQLADRSNAVVADGVHYRVGKEDALGSKSCRGFGGRGFMFTSIDGSQLIRSTNVWFQGKIPNFARKQFPDTHRVLQSV